MLQDLTLYAELLVPLIGSFMYGFLSRELWRQRAILPGILAARLLFTSLMIWYAGSLLDELAAILIAESPLWARVGPGIDVLRSFGWLSSFPLLAHTAWAMTGWRSHWLWLLPGYASLLLFVPSAADVLQQGETVLTRVSRDAYTTVVVHVSLSTALAIAVILRARNDEEPREYALFFRWLLAALVTVEALVLLGATLFEVWSVAWWRLLVSSSGLVIGATFLYFVRRYNLLSLSLSNRSLRHFSLLVALVFLTLLAGPALGAAGHPVFHRVIAWGICLAVLAGSLMSPALRLVARASPRLSRLLRRSIPHQRLARVSDALKNLDASDDALKEVVSAEVSQWTGTKAHFRAGTDEDANALSLYFRKADSRGFSRLRAPTTELADALITEELHAVFPLRISGGLDSIFAIPSGTLGGGYEDGELDSIQLVVDQLTAALELRRLALERVASERKGAEQERLSMLGMVAASLAHELKNPLSSMKALAQTVHEELERERASSDQARDLEVIIEQVDRLNDVAREILGFAKPSDSNSAVVEELALSAAYVLDHEARRRGITITSSGVETVGAVPGTPAAWQTILFNLMANAIQHAPDGSTVKIRLAQEESGVVFECENAGEAIEEEVAATLFDPFVSGNATAPDAGTGLGLALVSRRVHELGGAVELSGEAGRIIFRVEVPIDEPT